MSDRITLEHCEIEITFVRRLCWIRNDLSCSVDSSVTPKHKTATWIFLEAIQTIFDRIGKQDVILIQEDDKLSFARAQAGIAGGRYILVRLININDFRKRACDIPGIIGGTVVHRDDLRPG